MNDLLSGVTPRVVPFRATLLQLYSPCQPSCEVRVRKAADASDVERRMGGKADGSHAGNLSEAGDIHRGCSRYGRAIAHLPIRVVSPTLHAATRQQSARFATDSKSYTNTTT